MDVIDVVIYTEVVIYSIWDVDAHWLVVLFFAIWFVACVVLCRELFYCRPRALCVALRPFELEIYRGGVQLAIRYEVDVVDMVVREMTYVVRPFSDVPFVGY